jgi:hypothetical protein
MQDTFIGASTCPDELGKPHTFRYSLLTRQLPAGAFLFEEYGVQVAEEGGSCVQLSGLTHSRTRIDALLALLVEHTVSPTSLYDVVEDWAKENHLPQPKPQQVVEMN